MIFIQRDWIIFVLSAAEDVAVATVTAGGLEPLLIKNQQCYWFRRTLNFKDELFPMKRCAECTTVLIFSTTFWLTRSYLHTELSIRYITVSRMEKVWQVKWKITMTFCFQWERTKKKKGIHTNWLDIRFLRARFSLSLPIATVCSYSVSVLYSRR